NNRIRSVQTLADPSFQFAVQNDSFVVEFAGPDFEVAGDTGSFGGGDLRAGNGEVVEEVAAHGDFATDDRDGDVRLRCFVDDVVSDVESRFAGSLGDGGHIVLERDFFEFAVDEIATRTIVSRPNN